MSSKVVEDHKKMIVLSGQISEFQLNNLRQYPFVVFDDYIDTIELEYNFLKEVEKEDQKENEEPVEVIYPGDVSYTINFKKTPEYSKEEMEYRLTQLAKWVKYLFWLETTVHINYGDKEWVM